MEIRRTILALCLAALAPLPAAQAQTLPGAPPLAASSNVELLGNVPGSFFGIYFKGNHAYATGATGLTIFDISSPTEPRIVGELPLPHFENEDVDVCGNLLVISNDAINPAAPLYVIDVSEPATPTIVGTINLGSQGPDTGAGHIANFVGRGCRTLWVDGGDRVEVVSLANPAQPRSLGAFTSWASRSDFNVTHDTEFDSSGVAWSVGGGGAAGYRLTKRHLRPRLIATTGAAARNPSRLNDFILHNSQRRGNTLLVTEEDYIDTNEQQPGSCNGQGKFETYRIDTTRGRLVPLDTWETELNGMFTGGAPDSKAPVTVNCSSHWFDARRSVAAIGWYEQGVRFLDYSNPGRLRQVGYYIPANGSTWAAYWSPTAPNHNIVYTADAYRGLDVLRIRDGGRAAATTTAPVLDRWFGGTPSLPFKSTIGDFAATGRFGWACPIPKI